ncbi:hypothetical protein GCM10010300_34430 [Streptomyces olivaceoviridis]|nr:hypothetical protein GCM10010300_34430 [Streptomyces olivaceoviridis]
MAVFAARPGVVRARHEFGVLMLAGAVDADLAELVLDDGDPQAVVLGKGAVEEGGLAGAEEAGQDGDGDPRARRPAALLQDREEDSGALAAAADLLAEDGRPAGRSPRWRSPFRCRRRGRRAPVPAQPSHRLCPACPG